MMSIEKNNEYRRIPFSSEFAQGDFYMQSTISELISKCKKDEGTTIKIRTIGIIESVNGNFFLKDVGSVSDISKEILVSMAYIKYPLQPSGMPYSAQIFGTLQWINRPVIFANIIQVLNTTTAIRLSEVIKKICMSHVADINTSE